MRRRLPEDLQVAVSIADTYGWWMESEVLALDLRHVDLATGALRLDPGTTKNGAGRLGGLPDELKEALAAQVAA